MVWISVKDKLPEKDLPVLIIRFGDIRLGERLWEHPTYEETFEPFWYWDDSINDGQGWENDEITHWMPLPEPPEEKSNAKTN